MMRKIKIYLVAFTLSASIVSVKGSLQEDAFMQSYNILTTVAGKGGNCNSDENGWRNKFEGGSAIKADLSSPHMSMADSAGNIYIADKDAHSIRKVDIRGIITTFAGTNAMGDGGDGPANAQALSSPNGLWVNKKGDVYILDLGNNKIRKVDTQGIMTTVLHDSTAIVAGRGLWVCKTEDTIWYAGGKGIRMWTKSGGIVTYAKGFDDLGNMVQDTNGYLVATDRSASRVYRIDSKGNKTVIAGNGSDTGGGDGFPALSTAFYGVRGVWFLPDNSYFLATHEGCQVWHIDNEGIAHLFLKGQKGDAVHSGDGENFQTPGFKVSEVRAVTVDYQGNVLVTENDCGYIRKVAKRSTAVLPKATAVAGMPLRISINPSIGQTLLTFNLSSPEKVGIRIFNQQGRVEKIPMTYKITSDKHIIQWENHYLPSGVYVISMQSKAFNATRKYIVY
jgi:hypothetical protein